MTHAERCPVCFGSGTKVVERLASTCAPYKETCHGCGGNGWVTVGDAVEIQGEVGDLPGTTTLPPFTTTWAVDGAGVPVAVHTWDSGTDVLC